MPETTVTPFRDLAPISVFAAAHRLRGITTRTALRRSAALSAVTRRDTHLKCECEQVTGSYKLRGAYNAIVALDANERARGVVASSAGNHGLGVAWTAHRLGIEATIFVPQTAPAVKREGIAALGATVIATAPHYDAAMDQALAFAEEHGATFIHPGQSPDLLAGQGTVALEIIEDLPELRTIVVPVGGAGLLGGTGLLLRTLAPHVRIIGVQSEETAAMSRSLEAGHPTSVPHAPTLADGLAGDIDDYGFDVGRASLDEMLTVSEWEIARAIAWLWREEQLVVEGAGAVGAAAALTGLLAHSDGPIAIVLSGGNIDRARLDVILRQAGGGAELPSPATDD